MYASSAVWPAGYGRRVLAEVDSTNAEGARLAPDITEPTWILGLCQTHGRGRRGRPWADPHGNFAATLVLPDPGDVASAAQRSFVAALALYDALHALAPQTDLALKWPNDVLLGGGKVAGILLETAGQGRAMAPLCIGIGVNLTTAPIAGALEPGALRPVSLFERTGHSVAPEALLDRLAPAFADWELRFRTYGFAPVRAAFLDRAARRGQRVMARTAGHSIAGIFEDIDPTGALVLRTSTGPVTIPAADIHF